MGSYNHRSVIFATQQWLIVEFKQYSTTSLVVIPSLVVVPILGPRASSSKTVPCKYCSCGTNSTDGCVF